MREGIALSFLGGCFNPSLFPLGFLELLFECECPNHEQPWGFHLCIFQTHRCVTARSFCFPMVLLPVLLPRSSCRKLPNIVQPKPGWLPNQPVNHNSMWCSEKIDTTHRLRDEQILVYCGKFLLLSFKIFHSIIEPLWNKRRNQTNIILLFLPVSFFLYSLSVCGVSH